MAVIGTFGSFTAARLGIYASQASLNVTGNNIANINTEGYTRQRMDLVSLYSYGTVRYVNSFQTNIGYGVLTTGVSQLRDPLLDIRYREENASLGAYESKLDCLDQLSNILDEVGKGDEEFGVIAAQLSDFLGQLQELCGKVGSVENDTVARGSAQTLARLFNSYSNAMDTLAANKLEELKANVKTVNALLTQIRDLNVQIRDAGIAGDQALELRDARNLCIDQLSSYIKIDVRYDDEKIDEFNSVQRINISIADSGTPPIMLVQGVYAGQISMPEELEDGTPNAKEGSKDNLLTMFVEAPTDAKGRVLRNADHVKYETVELGDNALYGSLQSLREFLTEKGEFSSQDDIDRDPNATQKRGIQYYQNSLDALARKFADSFNKANQLNIEDVYSAYVADETNDRYLGSDGTAIMDSEGNEIKPSFFKDLAERLNEGGELSEDDISKAYEYMEALRSGGAKLTDLWGFYNGGVLFSNNGDNNDPTGITAGNISVSEAWSTGAVRILNTKVADGIDHSTSNDNIVHMIAMMSEDMDYFPNEILDNVANGGKDRYFTGSFAERLADMNSILAVETNTTTMLYNEYGTTTLSLENGRLSVSGVDLNDEATNMMVYQKAYAAACQLMTTLDSMLDKLINGTI